jgi:hypothetical protein
MRLRRLFWVWVAVIVLALVGCQKAEPTPVTSTQPEESVARGPGGMPGTTALALGTLKLEGTGDAVTPQQAAALLPLWQAIAGGSLKGNAEVQAVVKQIEGQMTDSQLAAIEDMELTWQDIQAWMQEQGIEMPARPGGGQGGPGAFRNLSEEERARLREEFQNMSPEQRATRMAEMGIQRPQGGAQGGAQGGRQGRRATGGAGPLIAPLIELLTERAAG